MIKAGQQRRFEMESSQEEKLNSVDVSLPCQSGMGVCQLGANNPSYSVGSKPM
jgi:hypothetical protein